MASKTNRSLQVKYKKSLKQRQALGEAEFSKPAYLTNKPALRELAANAQHMVRPPQRDIVTWSEPKTMLYNPSIHRAPKPLAIRCMVDCDGELIRACEVRKDYLRG